MLALQVPAGRGLLLPGTRRIAGLPPLPGRGAHAMHMRRTRCARGMHMHMRCARAAEHFVVRMQWLLYCASTGALRQEPGHLPGAASVHLSGHLLQHDQHWLHSLAYLLAYVLMMAHFPFSGNIRAHRAARGADRQPPLVHRRLRAGVRAGAHASATRAPRRSAAWPKLGQSEVKRPALG